MFNDFPETDDLAATIAAPPRRELPQDAASVRIRASAPGQYTVGPCSRCGGSGSYGSFGTCFKCQGSGKQRQRVYKTSPEQRARNTAKVADRKLRDFNANQAAYAAAQPAAWAWMQANPNFEFARDMAHAVGQYGSLTEGRQAAVDRCVARDAAKQEARADRAQQAASAEFPNLRAAFQALLDKGVRKAQMTAGEINVSLASMAGKNPGALYVKDGDEYAGKIVGTTFRPAFACKPDLLARLTLIEADPTAAVIAHAKQTAERLAAAAANGEKLTLPCGCCGLTLSNPVSIARGIGPICAGKWGF
jgi:hypothetical protein